jgi:hypothetical protein
MSDVIFLSLYDYLGHAAGQQLGKQVYETALCLSIQTQEREVSNKKYSGRIKMYPKPFLEAYFNNKIEKVLMDFDLPF